MSLFGWHFDLVVVALAVIGADRVLQWLIHLELPRRKGRP